jgi:hypothetical protein
MKKIITLLVVLGVALSLGGCFKKGESIDQNDSKKQQQPTLREWFESGKGVKCIIDTPEGEVEVSSKGDKVRIDGIAYADMSNPASAGETQKGTTLTNGDWIYMWSGKNGTKMNIEEMNKISEDMGDDEQIDPEDYSWESWVGDQEDDESIYECSEEKFSDAVFEAPSDVEFKDLGEMMKGLSELTGGLMGDAGEGDDVPGFKGSQAMSQEDIEQRLEEMMKNVGVE